MATYVYRAGKVGKLKPEVKKEDYLTKHPDAKIVDAPPDTETMEEWVNAGVAEALDGCRVEPDGECEHGLPSWLRALGYI